MAPPPNGNKGLAALCFCLYLATNLGALLLASASQRAPTRYINSTAVTLSEVLKVAVSVLAIYAEARGLGGAARTVLATLLGSPAELLRVCVPALLYTIQNNVIYAALAHLDAVSFQMAYQLKIVAAMLAQRVLLKKPASYARWVSVLILTLGVCLVQLSLKEGDGDGEDAAPAPAPEAASADEGGSGDPAAAAAAAAAAGRSRTLGLLACLVACGCSGLAGAFMELLLKGSTLSLPRRNLQVAAISVLIAAFHMLNRDADALRAGGFFQGYTPLVWAMVALDAGGGLLVSMLLKYSSATMKNFAAPIGIILNCLLSFYRDKSFKPNKRFLLGTAMVILALGMYTASG